MKNYFLLYKVQIIFKSTETLDYPLLNNPEQNDASTHLFISYDFI